MDITNMVTKLPWHEKRRWATRDLLTINKIIIHQELGDGSIEEVNNYHKTPGPNNHISPNGAPHFCYHYGIRMKENNGGPDGEIVQANELAHITWHTKGENKTGVGIMLEGNFKGIGHILGNDGPTEMQMSSLKWLVGHLLVSLNLTNQNVYGHYHYKKPACPGIQVSEWIEEYRSSMDIEGKDPIKSITPKELQEMLLELGYNLGKEGADGHIGSYTTAAIRDFQSQYGLVVDGVPGPQTCKQLLTETA